MAQNPTDYPQTYQYDLDFETRVAEVHARQQELHMQPRADSKLTLMYAARQLPDSMDAAMVARELMATDFIYKHTLYEEVLPQFMRSVANTLRQRHALSWSATWIIVRAYAPMALKLMMLSSSGYFIPEHLAAPEEEKRDEVAVA